MDEVGEHAEANAERRSLARKAERAAARWQDGRNRRQGSRADFETATNADIEEVGINFKEMLPSLVQEEERKLIDMEQVTRVALERVESNGIIFLDEIDKIAGRETGHGPDVSRGGVQRDILSIVEGTTVNTRHGFVRTDHILFIAAGAFHLSKPSDMISELQRRFPI